MNTLMPNARLSDAIRAFMKLDLADRKIETQFWYSDRLLAFSAWIEGDRPLDVIREIDLMTWYAWICSAERGLSPATARGHVRAVKRLFGWLVKNHVLDVDPSTCLRLPEIPHYKQRGISEENARRILKAASENIRDYALILFLESTGCRRAGVAGLLIDDLDLERRRAMVREKGDKERAVYFNQKCQAALADWLKDRPKTAYENVFLGKSPADREWHPLSPDSVSAILDRYRRKLGLKGPCSPHQWRHRFGRRMSRRGMNLGILAQIMGHEDPHITIWFYGGFGDDELQAAYDEKW